MRPITTYRAILITLVLLLSALLLIGQDPHRLVLRDILYQSREGYPLPSSVVADAQQGAVIFTVLYQENGGCWETYKLEWTFSEDMSELPLGSAPSEYAYEMRTFRYSGDCGSIEPWRNPSAILRGHKGHASWLMEQQGRSFQPLTEALDSRGEHVYFRKDQKVQHDNLPFGYYKGTIAVQEDVFQVGQFSFFQILITGNSNTGRKSDGFQYEVVYVYEIEDGAAPPTAGLEGASREIPPIQLDPPVIHHNLQDKEGSWHMGVTVGGCVPPRIGTNFQLMVRFTREDGTPLSALPGEKKFVDLHGNAVTGTSMHYLPAYELDLASYQIWMPYRALNLHSTGDTHTIYAHAELYIDGRSVAISKRTPIDILY